jgi:diguanylate cyclase (GGDEF) domain
MPVSTLQYDIYRVIAPLALGVLAMLLVLSLGKGGRGQAVSRVYSLFVVTCLGYLASNYLEMISGTESGNLLWSRVAYFFIAPLPLIWFDFCLRFTRGGKGLPRAFLLLSSLLPLATLVIVTVPSLSTLMWSSVQFFRYGNYILSVRGHGWWFAIYAIYTYCFFLVGCAVIVRSLAHYRKFYSKQSAWVLIGVAVPLASSFVYVFKPFPSLMKDYTPIGYAISATLFYVALFHRGLFSIAPVARATVVERLAEGVLVLDAGDTLVDANPAAMKMLGLGEDALGKALTVSAKGPLLDAIVSRESRDVDAVNGGAKRNFHIDSSGLQDGRLIVVSDQTELRALLSRVEMLAMRDELSGLPNRRCFLSESEREMSRARRRGLSLSAAMIDFDDFKGINDTRGHAAGDAVLRAFGAIVAEEARAEDVVGRIGGDEFALLTVGGPESVGVRSLCERLRARLAEADIRDEAGLAVRATISVGIANYDEATMPGLDRLLSAADQALYEAKRNGRNAIKTHGAD